jgi:hypothetical protein
VHSSNVPEKRGTVVGGVQQHQQNNELRKNIQQTEKQLQRNCDGLSVVGHLQNAQSAAVQIDGQILPQENDDVQSEGECGSAVAEGNAAQNLIEEFLHRRQ